MEKRFALSAEQIFPLIPAMGYCHATDRITVDAAGVGFMYREFPDKPNDSGWRFFSGGESQEYADDAANIMLCDVNTIANYDRAIIPYLKTDPPCAFERMQNGGYIAVDTDFMDEDRQDWYDLVHFGLGREQYDSRERLGHGVLKWKISRCRRVIGVVTTESPSYPQFGVTNRTDN